jgi:hypothetical protein
MTEAGLEFLIVGRRRLTTSAGANQWLSYPVGKRFLGGDWNVDTVLQDEAATLGFH